jgi:uncharacterized protein YecE (DUF72 family)
LEFYIGTSGWSYSSWKDIFYPEKLEQKWYLPYYTQVFNYVEIDTSFYQIPSKNMVRLWNGRTPPNFKFSAKFPRVITHEKKFRHCEKELELFYNTMLPLKDKLLTLLIQFPPSFKIQEGLEALGKFDFYFDETYRYAIEVRHPSWFNDLAYNFFKKNNICLVWNQLDIVQTPPVVTTDFTYIRFIGDRSISEKDFGTIQRDRAVEMLNWANKLKEVKKYEKDVNAALVAANNHYAGYGPETANMMREMLGLERVSWGTEKDLPRMVEYEQVSDHQFHKLKRMKQTSLSDFIKK